MVSIVFAMFAIVYPWASSSILLYVNQANNWYSSKQNVAKERIVIEFAMFDTTTKKTVFCIRNVGDIDVNIVDIYVDGNATALNGVDFSYLTYVNGTTPTLLSAFNNGYPIYAKTEALKNTASFYVTIPKADGTPLMYSTVSINVVTARGSQARANAS